MPYCMNCGVKLPDNAKFCYSCGTSVPVVNNIAKMSTHEDKKHVRAEKMFACPNCGSNISRMDAICPYCGSKIVDREVAFSVKEFAEKMYEIECAENEKGNSILGVLGFQKAIERGYGSKTFDRKISLISTFPIPNTIEEITEFVIMAANSIDVQWGKDTFSNRMWAKPGTSYYTDITLANTWINKLQQAYEKAKIAFPHDPMFKRIEEIYSKKMKELRRLK